MAVSIDIERENEIIESAYRTLLDGYLHSNHRKKVEIIERAYHFAREAHKGIRRRSGEPYILHPIAVATIASQEIGLGSTSICAALLHDVVEDTDYTVEDIADQFGEKIASIVDGLTKISGGIFGANASAQAENFRKLLLTMSSDFRVILIKMADRLHNMRTLSSMPPAKQYKIAGETLYIYAPLAHRLGLFAIKTELEDLSFKYEHPDKFREITHDIEASEQSRNDVFERFAAPINEKLRALGLDFEFKARVKSCYSIWKKMDTKHIPFSEVYDLFAARIVFRCPPGDDEKRWCWTIYSAITDIYRLHPDRIRDWINTPKPNGYRALHITVMGPDGNWIEVQIRSEKMDDIAERGFAAHWKYKMGEGEEDNELATWLSSIEETLRNPEPNALDFLDTIKLDLYARDISVFTPRGEIISMPPGATVLDFAFTIHSELGKHCIAGKVNHRLMPLSHKLKSGDQVEVLTSKSQTPKPEWTKFVVSAKGKTRLHLALRHYRRQMIDSGEKLLREFLDKHGVTLSNSLLARIINRERAQNKEELFVRIAAGEIELEQRLGGDAEQKKSQQGFFNRLLTNPFASKQKAEQLAENEITEITDLKKDAKKVYVLRTVNGRSNYRFENCCHPVPGDDVLGCVTPNNDVVVHKMNCPTAMKLKSSFGGSLVQTRWDLTTQETFFAQLSIEGIDRMGILQEIIHIISTNLAINIRSLNIKANNGVFNCELEVLVQDATSITRMTKRLKKVKGVNSATRIS